MSVQYLKKLYPWSQNSFFPCRCSHSVALLCCNTPNTFGNQPQSGNVKSCELILFDSERPICFPYAWLHRRRNWWERAVVFTSGVMDWVTACRPRMVPLWKGPPSSTPHLQLPCMMARYFTSVLWIEPSALTPFPELSFPWASSYSTSSTGSPIKCCDMRTSMQICKMLSDCLSDLHYNEEMCKEAYLLLKNIAKSLCSGASSGSQTRSD